jgi:hypothetical protein
MFQVATEVGRMLNETDSFTPPTRSAIRPVFALSAMQVQTATEPVYEEEPVGSNPEMRCAFTAVPPNRRTAVLADELSIALANKLPHLFSETLANLSGVGEQEKPK